ncbi:unnamed protein product [Adineta steineri]|uniref:NAD(P)(+)--arginine ADP-ribosyltransferase n=1 Tax=Adineta steineri TaxID=433720 RepID=A0A813QIV1_9BILA|nr:unnamed protein product [Adineta steineri]CAF1271059.1 unnamed protein product [Adineta steineri]CAF3789179.1 unnamed protein product [Adineta steineri]CAF3826675.1 unnamed protein product [Adineta steineri]
MASAVPNTRVQWLWKANNDPFSGLEPARWELYSDVENIIIEDAFQAGESHAVLDTYSINFKHGIQILNNDGSKQRPIKRQIINRADQPPRKERFTFTPTNPDRPFAGLYGWISPFVRGAAKELNITYSQLPSKDRTVVRMIVERAATGIIEEGKKVGKQHEAKKMAEMLTAKKSLGMKEVWKCCARLYSMDSFLYRKLNEAMRLIGSLEHEQEWRTNIHTLGPFCLLLWDNPFGDKSTEPGTIFYRGATLSDQSISVFKKDCLEKRKKSRSFPAFTSCTRNLQIAELYGNVLFIMTVKYAFTVDIAPFSQYPDEEEELLSPGVCFTIERVEYKDNKYMVYLTLVQQYNQTDRAEINDPRNLVFLDRILDYAAGLPLFTRLRDGSGLDWS